MSLVNDMLQDLERRGAPGFDEQAPSVANLRAATGTSSARRGVLGLTAGALVLLGSATGAWWWLAANGEHTGASAAASEAAARVATSGHAPQDKPAKSATDTKRDASPSGAEVAKASGTDTDPTPRARSSEKDTRSAKAGPDDAGAPRPHVVGLRTGHEDGRTRVVLDVDQPVEPRLELEGHRATLLVPGARTSGDLHVANGEQSLIERIDTQVHESGLRVAVQATRPVEARTSTLAPGDDRGHRVVLDLTARAPNEPVADADDASAETAATSSDNEKVSGSPARQSRNRDTAGDGSRIEKRARPLDPGQRARLAYREGRERLERGDRRAARARFRSALEHDPDHAAARQALAALLLHSGRVAEAAPLLAEGVRRHPDHAGMVRLHARVLAGRGRIDEALTELRDAVANAGDDAAFYGLLAALSQRKGAHEDAAKAYRRALALRPGEARWWLGLGLALQARERPGQALEALRRARRIGGLGTEVADYIDARIRALAAEDRSRDRALGMRSR